MVTEEGQAEGYLVQDICGGMLRPGYGGGQGSEMGMLGKLTGIWEAGLILHSGND